MAIIKCKMCGGDLNITSDMTVAECEYCGSMQTVPVVDTEKKLSMFARANRIRLDCEFDRAAGIYDSIISDYPMEAEAYWGLVLCKYGIEYVTDPVTDKRIPTCHRSSFDSVMDDSNYEKVMEYADVVARKVYREEAKAIEELRKGIIEISGKEEPYDIFISYKDTDDTGERTLDSVLAQDIYRELTKLGYRVFFSRITLEKKLGTEYEPYIFAALNSAKLMLVVGTDYDHFNAVWVKNEWSRYLQLMAADTSKHLIPCFKDMDAYDMPKEFRKLSAQNLGKVGAMQDLLYGVEKLLPREDKKAAPVVQQVVQTGGPNVEAMVKRGNLALEERNWKQAEEFFDRALDMNAECGEAYLGKFLIGLKATRLEGLCYRWMREAGTEDKTEEVLRLPGDRKAQICSANDLSGYLTAEEIAREFKFNNTYYSSVQHYEKLLGEVNRAFSVIACKRIEQFGNDALKKAVNAEKEKAIAWLNEHIEKTKAEDTASVARIQREYADYLVAFEQKAVAMRTAAEQKREDEYQAAIAEFEKAATIPAYRQVKKTLGLEKFAGYKEHMKYISLCDERIAEIKAAEEKAKAQKKAENIAKAKKIGIIAAVLAVVVAIGYFAATMYIIPEVKYKAAVSLMEKGQYEEAITEFEALDGYKNSSEQVNECMYLKAMEAVSEGKYEDAVIALKAIDGYKDSAERIVELNTVLIPEQNYQLALNMLEQKKYTEAIKVFKRLGEYRNSVEQFEISQKEQLKVSKVGDTVLFGSYEQDNYGSNGAEIVEWIVLAKENDRALVISKYGIECEKYSRLYQDVTWESSTLRTWLNGVFYNSAFSEAEQAQILTVTVTADKNPDYNTSPGKATKDKVFLLSIAEANQYFGSDAARKCEPTAYAETHGSSSSMSSGYWWLRSPGYSQQSAACVDLGGGVYESGESVYNEYLAVRPAMWIDIS